MFWQEMKKQWKRPEIIVAFIVICGIQLIVTVYFAPHDDKKAYNQAYEKYGGVMDAQWRKEIAVQMNANVDPSSENPTADFVVLKSAYTYTEFKTMLEQHIAKLEQHYDAEKVAQSYAKLLHQTDQLIFTGIPTMNQIVSMGYPVMARCMLLFCILFCGAFFNLELHHSTYELLQVSKHGKKRLYWCMFWTNQCSMLLVTVVLMAIMALSMTIFAGWNGLDRFVQDFVVNICPYPWNARTLLAVMALLTVVTSQVSAMVMFVIARYIRSIVAVIYSGLVVLLLPVFAASTFYFARFWFTNNLYSYHLWSDYSEHWIGKWYLTDWQIAFSGLGIVFVVALVLICLQQSKMIEVVSKKEDIEYML